MSEGQNKMLQSQEEGDDVYDYFIYNMDQLLHEPNGPGRYLPDKVPGEVDSDHDSQDSNIEDREEHDYPEERSSYEGNDEGYSDREAEDEEIVAHRYNQKQVTLRNKILDKIRKTPEFNGGDHYDLDLKVPKRPEGDYDEDGDIYM